MRVLIVEDDRRLANVLRSGLEEEGFGVDVVSEGEDAIAAASSTPFDILTLDVMLPGGQDGFQVSSELRKRRIQTPVLMLTARDAVEDRVRGLGAGADDYLVKPFAFAEFLARVRALTRRHLENRSSVLETGNLRLDTGAHQLSVDGRPVKLTAKEFSILEYFMLHPEQVLSQAQIEEHIWSYAFESESNLVEVYVARIRRKLAAAGSGDPIVTLRGVGYRFDPGLACANGSAAPASA